MYINYTRVGSFARIYKSTVLLFLTEYYMWVYCVVHYLYIVTYICITQQSVRGITVNRYDFIYSGRVLTVLYLIKNLYTYCMSQAELSIAISILYTILDLVFVCCFLSEVIYV